MNTWETHDDRPSVTAELEPYQGDGCGIWPLFGLMGVAATILTVILIAIM